MVIYMDYYWIKSGAILGPLVKSAKWRLLVMGRPCPILGTAVYLDCLDCEDKQCKKQYKYQKIVVGIDQSYNNTGISIAADGKLKIVRSLRLDKYKTNSEKRRALADTLDGLLRSVASKAREVVCIIERIRLRSDGFLNIDNYKVHRSIELYNCRYVP